jgi:membrane protease YdiL (CAAX protease family)
VIAERSWGPSKALLGILVLVVVVALEGAVVSIIDPGLHSVGAKLALQAMLAVTLAAVAFFMAGTDGRAAAPAALGLRRPSGNPVRTAIIGYAAYFAFVIVYANTVQPHQKDLTRALGFNHGAVAAVVIGLLVVLAAPISEEIFFRGFLFGGLRRGLPFVGAAVVSALIFGAFHYTGVRSLTVLPQLAALGLVLAWVYERTGSIYPTMAIHAVNNAIAFVILIS